MELNIFDKKPEITIFEIIAISVFSISMFITLYATASILMMGFSIGIMFLYEKVSGKKWIWKKVRI